MRHKENELFFGKRMDEAWETGVRGGATWDKGRMSTNEIYKLSSMGRHGYYDELLWTLWDIKYNKMEPFKDIIFCIALLQIKIFKKKKKKKPTLSNWSI